MQSGAPAYMARVQAILSEIMIHESEKIERASNAIVETIRDDGMIYLFGTGHSAMLAEEGHHRAGGLANVCPILSSSVRLSEGVETSTAFERMSGVGEAILSRYPIQSGDTVFVFSNSGVNPVPMEAAIYAKEQGAMLITVCSFQHAQNVSAKIPSQQKLFDVADIAIDNHGVYGDAVVQVGDTALYSGPVSTISGAMILNAILTGAVTLAITQGIEPPVYVSSNIPAGDAHNAQLITKYRPRNPHL